jgi:hypothetical protein
MGRQGTEKSKLIVDELRISALLIRKLDHFGNTDFFN